MKSWFFACLFLLSLPLFAADYNVAGLERHRAERVAELTKADGWLSLIGLHFLNPGDNTVGRAATNRIVLAGGPDAVGTVTLAEDGAVTFTAAPGGSVKIEGAPAAPHSPLLPAMGTRPATLVTAGTVTFFVIERGGKKALRVRDLASARREHFVGIDYFPTDPAWRITARWMTYETPRAVPITNVLGQTTVYRVPGKAVFDYQGRTYEVLPLVEGPDQPLFFIFSDATSGDTTYGMRFLYADQPRDGAVVLDFNRIENPPCAFTPFATCPLPPKENQLPFPITAGEKNYRGTH